MDPLRGGSGDGNGDKRGSVARRRPRGSWAPMSNVSELPTLRRPHHAGPPTQTAGSTAMSPEEIIKNFKLSVDAAEFVPKTHAQPTHESVSYPQKHSVQSRIQMARGELSNDIHNQSHVQQQMMQSQFYDQGYNASQQQTHQHGYQQNQDLNKGIGNSSKDITQTMRRLSCFMNTLTLNPARFDFLAPMLKTCISPYFDTPSELGEIMDLIIKQSINEVNFRYTGARICRLLDNTAKTPKEKTAFRDTLSSLCRTETSQYSSVWQNENGMDESEQIKCHGFILFLAELVVQLDDEPAFHLGKLLVQLITTVLKKPAPNSAKHICQALKLAGQTLERDKSGSREMEDMMRALTRLVTEGQVDSHVGRMVHNVRELRNGNWGQPMQPAHENTGSDKGSEKSQQVSNEPVFYGPDGAVLTAEESEFLQDNVKDSVEFDDSGTLSNEFEDQSDDDEMCAQYEEFLKTIPDKNENKVRQ